jgi:tetratricopeptide (TPR) repeat protein
VLVLGAVYFSRSADAFSPTGRSATLRLRAYAWSYAWQMFNERPLQGHGQGGFVLTGDSYAANDVLHDPLVFGSRIAHVHNEWLEVLADLGSVGLVLIAAALLLTLRAGAWALAVSLPQCQRWALLALLGSLVGLTVEECFSVGLRVPGVGTLFYTVIGLIWALSAYRTSGLVRTLTRTSGRRIGTGTVAGLLGLVVLAVSQQDFAAGRDVYRAEEAMLTGDYDRAIEWAGRAASRLNPQRALTNRYRFSEAHLRAADYLQDRALDRQQRAQQMDPPDLRLLALAEEDYRLSDEHCERGSAELKELILRAPGFINHGRLGYWLNLTRARNAAARGDVEKQQALLRDAATAIQREMLRQPFSPSLATDYVKVAGPTLDLAEIIEVLARPLRHHRMTNPYLDLLGEMAADPEFGRYHEPLVQEARVAARARKVGPRFQESSETWAPERLRLAAAIHFLRGDYDRAREELEPAAEAYEALAATAPLGAASCHAELAICHFLAQPGDARPALASAARAIALAPESRSGRELKSNVRQRMVEFYLAADQEEEAVNLLNRTAPPGTSEDGLRQELAVRYRLMCESLLERREAGGILRKPPAQLAPKLQRWVGRAIELGPGDAYTHYLAADLAFYVGDDAATAAHLRDALENGLPTELAQQFLEVACEQRPDSQPLVSLRATLAPAAAPDAPSSDTPQRDPAPN